MNLAKVLLYVMSLLIKKRQQATLILIIQAKIVNVNYISTDLSAQMKSTWNDGQNSDR